MNTRIFTRVWELLHIIVLQFVGCLLSSSMMELVATSSKRTYVTHHAFQVCCSQSPCPHCRPLLTCASPGDTILKGRYGSGSVGSLCPGAPKVLFEPSEHLCEVWYYMWFCPPSYHLVGLLLCPSMWGIFFQHSPVNDCLSVNCNFVVLAEDECMSFYYAIVFVPHVTPYISVMKAVPRFKLQLSLNCL